VKAAVVGLGMMGRNHARVWGEIPGVELVGVVDPSPAALEAATRGRAVAGYDSLTKLLEDQRPDVLSVATPTSLHEDAVAEAVDSGVNVLVEKPVGPDVETATRIAERVRRAGVVAMVGHVERFNPALLELRRRLASGQIGDVFQFAARRVGPFPPRIRDVGVVQDLATHDLDQARHLLQRDVEILFAQTTQRVHTHFEDLVSIVGRASGGVVLSFEVNWLSPRKVREIAVIGQGGMLLADTLTQDLFLYENNWEEGSWRFLQNLRGVSEGNMVRFALRRVEPLRAELEAFLEAVRTGTPPACTMEDGVEALRLAEATLRSARDGVPVVLTPR
jgi:UDP-N-acetylglucosamine 3-dehydrogenase